MWPTDFENGVVKLLRSTSIWNGGTDLVRENFPCVFHHYTIPFESSIFCSLFSIVKIFVSFMITSLSYYLLVTMPPFFIQASSCLFLSISFSSWRVGDWDNPCVSLFSVVFVPIAPLALATSLTFDICRSCWLHIHRRMHDILHCPLQFVLHTSDFKNGIGFI